MKKSEVIEKLTEAGIEHDPEASVKELMALLPEGEGDGEEGVGEKEGAKTPKAPAPMGSFAAREDKIAMTKEKLAAEPKIRFMIPFDIGEKKGAYETVNINGYRLTIMKGVYVDLPESVVKVLSRFHQVSMEAGEDSLIETDAKKVEALS